MPGFKIFEIRHLAFVHADNWPVLIHRMFAIRKYFASLQIVNLLDSGTEIAFRAA
jgi:hypothetical protein